MAATSVYPIKTVCVLCSSNPGKDAEFVNIANHLGRVLAERKINLVYGGGSLGLMGCVATAAHLGGSNILGVVPTLLSKSLGKTLGTEVQTGCMHERISIMIANADAFIALPGDFGTLEEIFQIASWSQINLHQKPIGLLNVNNFYDGLFSFLNHAVEKRFLSPVTRQILITAATVEELLDQLQACMPQVALVTLPPNPEQGDSSGSKKQKLDLTLSL